MNILITGGASGLGAAITKTLAGYCSANKVYFTYNLSSDKAIEIENQYNNVSSVKCDFSDKESLELFIDNFAELNIDVLINNAWNGDFIKTHFHKINSLEFITDFGTSVYPTVRITQAAISLFRKKKAGKIITILTSGLIDKPPIGSSVYMANKAYLRQLSKIWAYENSKFNIVSNVISPSFMKTNFTDSIDERIVNQLIEEHPQKKILTIEEVAESVLFLVNASSQINGIDLPINSGTTIK